MPRKTKLLNVLFIVTRLLGGCRQLLGACSWRPRKSNHPVSNTLLVLLPRVRELLRDRVIQRILQAWL